MKTIASFMAIVMLVMALLIKFAGVEMDFHTTLSVSTLGVFAGCLASMFWSFRNLMPEWCGVEVCA